jgi:hypothetical protein
MTPLISDAKWKSDDTDQVDNGDFHFMIASNVAIDNSLAALAEESETSCLSGENK